MANIYVRKSGNDSNDGSTPALAKLTIAGAISAMNSDDIIYVGSGIYREQNINGGAKHITIIGDVTGEYTGDAGEIIWSGLNSTDDSYTAANYAITNTTSYDLTVKNILFENWKLANSGYCIYKNDAKNLTVDNCSFKNLFAENIGSFGAIYYKSNTYPALAKLTNILVDGVSYFATSSSLNLRPIYVYQDYAVSGIQIILKNILVKNMSIVNRTDSFSIVIPIYTYNDAESQIENLEVENIFHYAYSSSSNSSLIGMEFQTSRNTKIYNCSATNLFILSGNSGSSCLGIFATYYNAYAYNCNVFNVYNNGTAGTNYNVPHIVDCISKANYTIPKIYPISKYSLLKGVGNTSFPTTDIEGNPRPAYGNGTACDIGAVESTSDIIQKESTIKDSGDYSVKVAPCNYFKKVFQVPVTASELRTVKAKIRIDGTWGTYRPKITLSGQGMTASSATKNATTGSFEELTVSGTPTTTGIALLTIEAHSASTDAAFYIDTITIE